MSLQSGARLGSYEVSSQIGVGGMGEVYRATDTSLGRQVAIKVLPAAFSRDAERVARFEREARTLALLNHPNIAHIYGLERGAGQLALVMELVEGPTLADRVAQGAVPLDEALPIARQIAEALEAAHEQGIIHRDLKPANIKVRSDGTVKVLDFGLAKGLDPAGFGSQAGSDVTNSPTLTSPAMTQAGMILGTAAYMSPEQARGKPVDKRTDIWAFGCVLYEMLTGRRAFSGDGVTDVLARVLERDVDLSAVPASTPPAVRRLLRRCLEKDRKQRLTDIGVARLDIDEARTARPDEQAGAAPPAPVGTSRRERLLWAAALLVAAAVAGGVAYTRRPVVPPPPEVQFEIPVAAMRFASDLAISPDGRLVAYAAAAPDGRNGIWVRALDSLQAALLPGTETSNRQSMGPAWSPDGRFLVFAADGNLKKVDAGGGVPQTLTPLGGQSGGATWSPDDTILFASNDHGLRRISASGGEVTSASERDAALQEVYHDAPTFLPDGRRFLYLAWSETQPSSRAVYVASLDSKDRTRLMDAESNVAYAQGRLLFMKAESLMARPFDPARLQFTGEPVIVAQNLAKAGGELGAFAVADTGALIYRQANNQALNRQLVWMDRKGTSLPATDATFQTPAFQLSPDGRQIVFQESADIWTYDLERRLRTRLTTDPSPDHNPIWSADGSTILFDSHRSGDGGFDAAVFEKPANGATPERQILDSEKGWEHSPRAVSADGRTIIFGKAGPPNNKWNLWRLPLDGDRTPVPYRSGNFLESEAALSPDGQWLAFTSNESGRDEVIVQPFPDPSRGRWQISTDGGSAPRWRRDGRELFFVDRRGRMIAVSVTTAGSFAIEQAATLFQTPLPLPLGQGSGALPYDVTADGQRFLLLVPNTAATPSPIVVKLNWGTSESD